MRSPPRSVLARLAWLLLAAAPAAASPLDWSGTFEFRTSPVVRMTVPGFGVGEVGVSGPAHLASFALPAGAFRASGDRVTVSDPNVFPIAGLQFTFENGAAEFREAGGGSGGFGGTLPLHGVAKVCLFAACDAPLVNLTMPLDPVGAGTTAFVSGAVNLTVRGAPWTTGRISTTGGTTLAQGFAHGPDGLTSTTAQLGGRLNVVTPVFISTNLAALPVIYGVGELDLAFKKPDCEDGQDNDGDGRIDFPDDPGCSSAVDLSERQAGLVCDDGLDNDGDRVADYPADPGCQDLIDADERSETLVCDDGIDNDGDGFADFPADPGCSEPTDASERTPSLACDDGLDNDGDGWIDFPADPGCGSPWAMTEAPACQNGIDDDGDGLVDFGADPGCATYSDSSERDPSGPACDNGRDDDSDRHFDFPMDPGCADVGDASERDPALVCDDGIDGDEDGLVDFPADAGCSSPTDASEKSEDLVCDDGFDNDGDGLADFPRDPGCSNQRDASEQSASLVCDDGLDNDGDGLTDFPADPACTSLTYPSELEACQDGLDNDGDGRIDFPLDQGCSSATDASELEDCRDGIDNDGDGRIDFPADAGCSSTGDGSERDAALVCDDGIDNDADGLADFPADPGCSSARETSEVSSCQDGVDNDGDGRVDFPADPECVNAVDDWEASDLRYRGSLALELTIGSSLPALVLPGSGAALANFPMGPGATQLGIAGGDFAGAATVDVTDEGVAPIAGLRLSGRNESGSFSGSGERGLSGRMPLGGAVKVCLFAACSTPIADFSIPLSVVGAGGSAFVTGIVNLTVQGTAWTTGTVAVGTATAMGSPLPTSAPASTGRMTLVTPIFIRTNAATTWPRSHGFAFLTLEFVPEPDAALAGLIACGILGLLVLGRSRRER